VSLRQNQSRFAKMVGNLLQFAYANGYEVTLGEAWRPDWVAIQYAKQGIGVYPSFHTSKLAIDLNLFRDGLYLTETLDYKVLGEYWESLGGTWGGNFTHRKDGNHFSLGESEDDR